MQGQISLADVPLHSQSAVSQWRFLKPSSIMTFTLSPVDLSQEWDSFFACEWAAWTNPPQAIWELTYPILDTGPTAEASAVKNAAARQKQDVHADPLSRWMKIVDSDSGKIVAGALWRFYDTNPYRGPVKKSDATWLPKGELRDLCDEMHAQNRVWRPRIMPVAHARQYYSSVVT